MKKLKMLCLLLALMLIMVACAAPAAEKPESENETETPEVEGLDISITEPIEIDWWHALESQNQETAEAIIADYNKQSEFVTVTPVYQGSYSDVNEKLIAAQAANSLPALTVANTPYVAPYGNSGLAEVLDPYIAADDGWEIDDFGEGLIFSSQYDGQQIAFPFLISTQVIFYNKDIAEAEGIKLPETWTDIQGFLEKATVGERKATAIPGWDQWYFETYFLNQGVKIVNDDQVSTDLGSDKAIEIANQLKKWDNDGYLDWAYGADASTNMRQGFFDGKYFSVMHTSSLYNMYVENSDFEVGMAYYPGGDTRNSEVGGSFLIMPAKNEQDVKNASWDLIKYLTGKEVNMRWASETGYMPTRKSVIETDEGVKFLDEKPTFKVVFDNMDNILPRIQHSAYTQLADVWMEKIAYSILEGTDMNTTMAEAVVLIDEALADSVE